MDETPPYPSTSDQNSETSTISLPQGCCSHCGLSTLTSTPSSVDQNSSKQHDSPRLSGKGESRDCDEEKCSGISSCTGSIITRIYHQSSREVRNFDLRNSAPVRRKLTASSSLFSLQNMQSFLLLQLIAGLCLTNGARAQSTDEYFRNQPREDPYYVVAGKAGPWLDCSVASQYTTDQYRLQWLKIVNNSPRIISIGNNLQPGMSDLYDLDTSSSGSGSYNLRIITVSFNNDNGMFYCQVTGDSIQTQDSRPANVIVLVKPQAPQISRHPDSPIREGTRAEAVCESTEGNPAPDFTWFFSNGTEISQDFVTVEPAQTTSEPSVSRLTWSVSAEENNLHVTCRVWNRAMEERDATLEANSRRIQVLYPPKVRVGPVSEYNVEKGSRAVLDCTADGNPAPSTYRWQQKTGLAARSWEQANISFIADKEFSGNYSCQVSNSEGTGQASLKLDVLYEPQIYVQEILTVSEGKRLKLECNVDANPAAISIRWDGPGGVTSDRKTLEIYPAQKKDRGNYTCTAKNVLNLYGQGSTPRVSTARTEVKVSYRPGRGVISLESDQPIKVGDSVTLSCAADDLGFPLAQYKWKAPGEREYQFNSQNSYTIPNVQLTNAGTYHCMPHNQVGDGTEGSFTLNVNEPARLDQFLPIRQEFAENENGPTLPCSARGHPKPKITWYKDGKPLLDEETNQIKDDAHWSIVEFNDSTSCDIPERCSYKVSSRLQWIDKVRWSDKGLYTCKASNDIGQPHSGNMSMIVRHKPQIINSRSQLLAAADLAGQGKIICRVSALPEPHFRWFHNSQEISSGNNYAISTERNETYDVYASHLVVQNVAEIDMGQYRCKALNNLGDDEAIITLQKRTAPTPPTNLRRISYTHTSIEMGWDPGFNGGYDQTFVLAMRMLDPVSDRFGDVETPFEIPESTVSAWRDARRRRKRFVAAENPPITKNVTGLNPLSKYMFRLMAKNDFGPTDWLPWELSATRDVPESSAVAKPSDVHYHGSKGTITFKSTPDMSTLCLMVYFKREIDNQWRYWDCVKPIGEAGGLPKELQTVRVRYCIKTTMVCSNSTEALNAATVAGVPWKIVVPIVAVGLVLIALAILCCVCCFRKKSSKQKSAKTRLAGKSSKDYEQETNQARPKHISAPYMTGTAEKTPLSTDPSGPQGGIGGSQADSGVFTLGSHYQYEQGYSVAMGNGGMNGGYSNGGLHASYDEGGDRWGSAADPYGDMDPFVHGYTVQQPGDFPDMGGYTDGYPYYDHYGNPAGMVDMNPNGTLGPGESQDESLNSGYSTPNNRRIMREIIV